MFLSSGLGATAIRDVVRIYGPYLSHLLVAEHRADRLQLEVVVRAVGESLVRGRDGLEEGGFLRVSHGLIFEDDVVELGEAGRRGIAFQGQGVDQPRHLRQVVRLDGLSERLDQRRGDAP